MGKVNKKDEINLHKKLPEGTKIGGFSTLPS